MLFSVEHLGTVDELLQKLWCRSTETEKTMHSREMFGGIRDGPSRKLLYERLFTGVAKKLMRAGHGISNDDAKKTEIFRKTKKCTSGILNYIDQQLQKSSIIPPFVNRTTEVHALI